jgi:thiosulfate dehydrogenase [quinone] large subunit
MGYIAYHYSMTTYTLKQPWFPHFFYSNEKSAVFWLVVRVYLGYEWVTAGWAKVTSSAWVGSDAGAALTGFLQGALHKTAEFCAPAPAACHPDVQMWYAHFVQGVVLPHVVSWSHAIAFGEVLVGLGLIFGCFTGVAAFFGAFMNLNFMLAGTVSTNPILFIIAIFIVLAWRVAGHWGLDRYVGPYLAKRFNRGTS